MDSSLGIEIAEPKPQHHHHHHHHHIQQQTQTPQQPILTSQPNHVQQNCSPSNNHAPSNQLIQQNQTLLIEPQQAPQIKIQHPQSQPISNLNQSCKLQLNRAHPPHPLHETRPTPTQPSQIQTVAINNHELHKKTSTIHARSTHPDKSKILPEEIDIFFGKGLYNSCDATEKLIKDIEDSHDETLANRLLHLYQQHYSTLDRPWEHVTFMYGLGLIYMYFNAYKWAAKSFREALYVQPSFIRSRDIHTRLGLIFKATGRCKLSEKHFNLAIHDARRNSGTSTKPELKFQLAHLYEIQGKFDRALEIYEKLLQEKDLPQKLSANINRQIGWIHYNRTVAEGKSNSPFYGDIKGNNSHNDRERIDHRSMDSALRYLDASNRVQTDSETSYYIGRCLTTVGRFQDAFDSYRSVIDKEESTADTWCSIGVLYQRQNQPWDALQAYIRSVQYDKKHSVAWMNLGILYESHKQFKDALKCYRHVIRSISGEADKSLRDRIEYIQRHIQDAEASSTTSSNSNTKKNTHDSDSLLSLEDLWNLESKNNQDNNPSISSNTVDGSTSKSNRQPHENKIVNQYQINKSLNNKSNMNDYNVASTQPTHSSLIESESLAQRLTNGSCPNENRTVETSASTIKKSSDEVNDNNTKTYKIDSKSLPSSNSDSIGSDVVQPKREVHESNHNGTLSSQSEKPRAPIGQLDHLEFERQRQSQHSDSREFCFTQSITSGASKDSGISSDSSTYADCALVPSQNTDINNVSFTSAEQIVEACKNSIDKQLKLDIKLTGDDSKPPLEFPRIPPYPPHPSDKLFPSPPSIFLESKKELTLKRLQDLYQSHPISIVRNIATVLKLDLGLFSTKTLVESNPDQQIDVVSHLSQPNIPADPEALSTISSEEDINIAWSCERTRSHSTIARYAAYQVSSFRESLQMEKDNKWKPSLTKESETDSNESLMATARKNGNSVGTSPTTNDQKTNGPNPKKMKTRDMQKSLTFVKSADFIDLSDEKRWRPQLNELNKLPYFIRCVSASNMLTHIGAAIPGVNTISMSMHVPGCRIIGTKAPNNFCPVVINTGPGDYEWCAISGDYERLISKLCNRHGLDIDLHDWWPRLSDLQKYNVPIYRFSQRPGDLVWVNPGTFYWIHSTGWTNCIQWNIGPLCAKQYRLSSESFEVNKLVFKKSEVPMIQMTWNMVINIHIITDDDLFQSMTDVLKRSLRYCVMVLEFVEETNGSKKVKIVDHDPGPRQAKYCSLCEMEIFNISFKRKHSGELHCVECARRVDPTLNDYKVYQEYELKYLMEVYDNFIKFKRKFQAHQMHFKRQQLIQEHH